MKEIGYNHPLYLLPFDHRGAFLATQGGSNVPTTDHASDVAAAQQQLADAKYVVYDAFQKAMGSGV